MPSFDPNQTKIILPLAAFGHIGYFPVCPPGLQFVINAGRCRDRKVDIYGNTYVRRIGPGSQPSEAINVDSLDGKSTDGPSVPTQSSSRVGSAVQHNVGPDTASTPVSKTSSSCRRIDDHFSTELSAKSGERDVPPGYEAIACPICMSIMLHPVL
ncbi:hypothetical protein K438DRAFT_1974671 [Mycena galopus ATCC 62051]|nr:hypothetical protein K438DRAFT_1974671 [Mycena galopus ATCC 62051]